MRSFFLAFLLVTATAEGAPLRGTVLERDAAASGLFTVRAADYRVHCFHFDSGTSFEREGKRVPAAEIRNGDIVEVTSAPGSKPGEPYARTVQVMVAYVPPPPPAAVHLGPRRRLRPSLPAEELYPRGNLTLAGAVSELNEDRIVLHTRARGDTRILRRRDTRYVRDGVEVPASMLNVNTYIFVRGSRNLDGDFEAYQVMWGRIVQPDR